MSRVCSHLWGPRCQSESSSRGFRGQRSKLKGGTQQRWGLGCPVSQEVIHRTHQLQSQVRGGNSFHRLSSSQALRGTQGGSRVWVGNRSLGTVFQDLGGKGGCTQKWDWHAHLVNKGSADCPWLLLVSVGGSSIEHSFIHPVFTECAHYTDGPQLRIVQLKIFLLYSRVKVICI